MQGIFRSKNGQNFFYLTVYPYGVYYVFTKIPAGGIDTPKRETIHYFLCRLYGGGMETDMSETGDTVREENRCNCCRTKHTPRSQGQQKQLQNRLSRMIGQLNGISRMLEENRYCGDILIQISAAESALRSLSYLILEEHLGTCVTEKIMSGDKDIIKETVELVKKLK